MVKGACKNRAVGVFILGVAFLFFALNGYAGEKQAKDRVIKTGFGKERLVIRDIGRGADISLPRWCGNNALLFRGDNIGIEMIDFAKNKRVQISAGRGDMPLNCSSDGKWALYLDTKTFRTDSGDVSLEDEHVKGHELPGYTLYIYGHETATGKKERVAAVSTEGSYDALSHDGSRILLGPGHDYAMGSQVPEWQGVWFTNDWEPYGAKWFQDSSGVVFSRHNPNRICVEFFGKDGWARCFELGPEYKTNVVLQTVDGENRIYFTAGEVNDPAIDGRYFLYRCDIKGRELVCKKILERDRLHRLSFLPDGDMVFEGDDCILRLSPGQTHAECVVDKRYSYGRYQNIALYGVSPDGRWLVFDRSKVIETQNGEFSHWQSDLFVIELTNN